MRIPSPVREHSPDLAGVVERNIRALLRRARRDRDERSLDERVADAITRFAGSMKFVYLHALIYGAWILMNLGWLPGPHFDPTFVVLAMVASVEAIFLSTFVLITQNRMALLADKRAELDVQISLLSEHEITRLISLVDAVARKVGVDSARDSELDELEKDIAPERVLDVIEQESERSRDEDDDEE